jgi:hypothetical protein
MERSLPVGHALQQTLEYYNKKVLKLTLYTYTFHCFRHQSKSDMQERTSVWT